MRRGNTGTVTPAGDAVPEEPPTLQSDSDSESESEDAALGARACAAGVWDEDRDEDEDDGRCVRSTVTWRVPHFAALREDTDPDTDPDAADDDDDDLPPCDFVRYSAVEAHTGCVLAIDTDDVCSLFLFFFSLVVFLSRR